MLTQNRCLCGKYATNTPGTSLYLCRCGAVWDQRHREARMAIVGTMPSLAQLVEGGGNRKLVEAVKQ